nr:MAG TPA: hypothetical protein [Caudoviricetes sp.]
MNDLLKRAKEIRDEVRIGRNTASRVGGLLVDIVGQVGGAGVFVPLGSILLNEFDDLTEPGYYTYSLQDGTGEINGILVVSRHGYSVTSQKRYELDGVYQRTFTDEGWEGWGDEFIFKLRTYIDNDTVYWDDSNQVIKAKGGGILQTVSIKASINHANIGQCSISATGDVLKIVEAEDKSNYYITATKTGTVTITVVPKDGYQVQKLNVDTVSQGAVSEYTFENLDADHTLYVWMEEMLVQTDTDFLIRSDHPDVTYSSVGACLASLQEDYPNGLTQDIMISCTRKATEIRGSQYNSQFGIWTSKLLDWNKDSIYTLTINGNDLYTINCRWLGGVLFENVDNIFIKGISILNYCNFSGAASPEELAAIMVRSTDDTDKIKNVAVHNCKFNGYYLNSSGAQAHTWNCLRFKNTANVIVDSCDLVKAGAVAIFMSGIESAEINRSNIQGDYYINSGGLGHANVLSITGSNGYLKIADTVLDAVGMIEYGCSINGISEVDLVRTMVKNCSGQPFAFSGDIQRMNIDSSLFYNNITNGQYMYVRRVFGFNDTVEELSMSNSTVYLNGEYSSSQEFLAGNIKILHNNNNIFINKLGKAYVAFYNYGGFTEYVANNNIYASAFWQDKPVNRFYSFSPVKATINDGEYLNFGFETRLLGNFKNAGYETDSVALSNTDSILNVDTGGDNYKLLDSLKDTYKSNKVYAPEFDIDYLRNSIPDVSVGAYNLFGEPWDETSDQSTGYEGSNTVDREAFSNANVYTASTDDLIIVRFNSKNRNNFIRSTFTSESGHSLMRFGQVITLSLQCNYTEDTGMYVSDNKYTLNVKEESYE